MKTISDIIRDVDTDDELFERVELCLNGFKISFVQLGFMLRVLKERGYDNAFLQERFGLSKSTINRSIQINEEYSVDGYSYKLDEKYVDFNKSQLIEMLPLSQEQRDEVTSDMSVSEIRQLKNSNVDEEDALEEDELEEDYHEEAPADSVPVDPVDELPVFDVPFDTVYQWIFDALYEPCHGNLNKMEGYLNVKEPFLINKEMDLYAYGDVYYFRLESSKYKVPCYNYYGFYQIRNCDYVKEHALVAYEDPITQCSVSHKILDYIRQNYLQNFIALENMNTDLFEDMDIDGYHFEVYDTSGDIVVSKGSRSLHIPFKDLSFRIISTVKDIIHHLFEYALEKYFPDDIQQIESSDFRIIGPFKYHIDLTQDPLEFFVLYDTDSYFYLNVEEVEIDSDIFCLDNDDSSNDFNCIRLYFKQLFGISFYDLLKEYVETIEK